MIIPQSWGRPNETRRRPPHNLDACTYMWSLGSTEIQSEAENCRQLRSHAHLRRTELMMTPDTDRARAPCRCSGCPSELFAAAAAGSLRACWTTQQSDLPSVEIREGIVE